MRRRDITSLYTQKSCRVLARALSTSVRRPATTRLTYKEPGSRGVVPNAPGYKKVMELQKLMCADDGLLVWQKRGVRDMGMYWASMTLMLGGVGAAFYQLFVMSFPKKK